MAEIALYYKIYQKVFVKMYIPRILYKSLKSFEPDLTELSSALAPEDSIK
jgi:hypothetical protein